MEGEDKKSTYRRMFTEIIDVTVTNVSGRLCDISILKLLCLLNPKQFANYQRDFPIEILNFLMENSAGVWIHCF
jgi:hypothetical protein